MTVRIFYGHFHYGLNLTPFPHCLSFSPTHKHSSAPLSRQFSATMGANLTTPPPARSSSLMVPNFVCPVHTPPPRTAKPSASFVPRTTWCVPSYSRPACHCPIGLMLCTLPPTSSTSYQPKLCTSRHRTLPCLALRPCTTTSACLVARVIPTHPPPHRISLPLGRLSVCFSNTPRIIKGTGVLIALAIGLSSLVMSRSMSPIFPLLLPSPHHRSPRILSF
jgi:hypothetical protein